MTIKINYAEKVAALAKFAASWGSKFSTLFKQEIFVTLRRHGERGAEKTFVGRRRSFFNFPILIIIGANKFQFSI
jgi:hypothetical protein